MHKPTKKLHTGNFEMHYASSFSTGFPTVLFSTRVIRLFLELPETII